MESMLGKPYDDIQEQILNLEQQIKNSSVFKGEEQRRALTYRLLDKLADQHEPVKELARRLEVVSQTLQEPLVQKDQVKACSDCVCASFSEALIAWYAVTLRNAYKNPLPPDTVPRTEKARRLVVLSSCVWRVLTYLTTVHPGSLLCEEFYSILIKARNEVIDDDLEEQLIGKVPQQERVVVRANTFARYYYGSNVKVFESLNRP